MSPLKGGDIVFLPWLEREVDSSHIVHAAYRLEKPRQTILKTLQRYAPILNLKLPEGDPETWDF
ncbi:hypothetical protein [Spirulina sp. 06S082]|uniref:hypothetical protein n=1 Tax=Spirulina sp. 06S082 TaxID=3110248 RepID=UPI002B20E322|nr:hypothetical protein [Spirulina sp. 06S082]MEA5472529.1 hypothetical protein [Spirulina sp. 06S082]